MKRANKFNRFIILALAAAVGVPAVQAANASTLNTPATYSVAHNAAQASNLLKEVRTLAREVSSDTDLLALSTGSNRLNWKTHLTYLNQAKDNINQIGAHLEALKGMKGSVHPWQQEAIDRIHASSLMAARHTDSALRHLNENKRWLFAPSYKSDLDSIQAHSAQVRETANNFLDYANTKNKLGGLQERLAYE
jgi:hypothetical protein